jgi:C1A family cysteine protease
MRMRTLRIAVGSLVCLALVAGFSTSGAQAPASPVPPQDGGEAPAFQIAPLRPRALEPSSYSKGYVPPPMDLSHLTGQRALSGGVSVQALPSAFDWRDTGKVTSVKNQSTCGSCYAFAALGNIESKLLLDGAGTFNFSENNAKECNWYETDGGGTSCSGGSYFVVANLFSKKGTVLETCDPYVASDVSCKSTCPYQKTLLDWRIVNGGTVPATGVLKQYIYDHGPVFTAIYAGYYDAWDTEFSSYDGSYTLYHAGTETPNHAVLIVGWDDSLTHTGGTGGWIVKNSWGTGWGDSGYFRIAYGSASIGTDSSFVYDWQDYDTSGGLMYYDEGGMSTAGGYGDTTAWGLAKFIPTSNTNVTRVEFWTSDATTDVDVYVYDDFNGTTLSNKLGEVLNNSFSEAGYHSVALSSPVPVTSGDDVIAVVKFTNDSYTYPIPVDNQGPSEAGRTYVSHSGTSGSWAAPGDDVAIRLRTSTSSGSAPTVTSITPNSGYYTETVHITNLAGTNFQSGATVKLTKSGQPNINGTSVSVVSESKITCDFDLNGAATGNWDVVVTNPDAQSGTLPYGFTVKAPGDQDFPAYLPLMTKRWPPIPDTPVLNAISNPDGNGNYTVSWGAADLAETYVLQEDDNSSFSSPARRYSGSGTSWYASGKAVDTYYYRVIAKNSWGSSDWSNVESVQVSPPAKLYAVADATVLSGAPGTNFGSATDMWVGYDLCYGGKTSRSLIRFDVSDIPAGTSISQAKMYLRLVNSCYRNAGSYTVTTYRAKSSWSSSSVTWNNQPGYGESYGSASVSATEGGWYSFDVTNLLRGWVNGSASNYGIVLRAPESSSTGIRLGFATVNSSYDPYLQITYTGMAASAEAVPPVEQVPNPTACGPTVKDVLGIFPGASDCGPFECFEQAACSPD